ncbi:MAG: tRNA (adenosine(37)-N6)-threonylcarbamoyltransferase complex ATPase subunit type 1 TsaE [Planctomycetota bacterium]
MDSLQATDQFASAAADVFTECFRERHEIDAAMQVGSSALVVALVGTLGVGKTHFTKRLLHHLGVIGDVVSPTFTLQQTYVADEIPGMVIYHMDAYRISDEDEFLALGVDEVFDSETPVLVLIEWADRVCGAMPFDTLWLEWQIEPSEIRTVAAYGTEVPWRDFVDRWGRQSDAPDGRLFG